ncbi:MAG: hypothetical protein MMC23_007220 [Stictis urceolatum]|nr:hypothetical protein [Stictis urceolata]
MNHARAVKHAVAFQQSKTMQERSHDVMGRNLVDMPFILVDLALRKSAIEPNMTAKFQESSPRIAGSVHTAPAARYTWLGSTLLEYGNLLGSEDSDSKNEDDEYDLDKEDGPAKEGTHQKRAS